MSTRRTQFGHLALHASVVIAFVSMTSVSAIADEHFYLRPVNGRQSFGIGYAGDDKARLLMVAEDAPLLVVKRFLHFSSMP